LANLSVRDLMTTDVVAVRREDSLTKVQELMHEKDVRHAPVVDDSGTLVGLVSERDVLRRALVPGADLPITVQADQITSIRAEDIMTCEVETVGPDEDAATAAQTMLDNKYGCLPVIEDGTLAGILTEADFVRFLTVVPPVPRRTGGRKHRAGRIVEPRIVK
jgi:CBS domain-containing membrane protein